MRQVEETRDLIRAQFGSDADCEGPLADSGAGVRITGVDLAPSLSPDQAETLLDALAWHRVVCIAGQDLGRFSLQHFERFANHWGAPVPHPTNFTRDGKPAQSDAASDGKIEWLPFEQRRVSAANSTFPKELQCLPHESPAVLVVTNFRGERQEKPVTIGHGGSWHTDIEYEPLPIYVSMFLCHRAPTARGQSGTWVEAPVFDKEKTGPYLDGSAEELYRRRLDLPLDGETAFADTAAAFAALSPEEQTELESTQLRRRLNVGDEGWLAPVVRTNPRSGIKSLHSPIWASRPRVRPAVDVEGMSPENSRAFLDRLEAHCLAPEYRYDHIHVPGDVTIWDNYMTLHNSPPIKSNIESTEDARLLYRLSCKGEGSPNLPRTDSQEWLDEHVCGGYRTPDEILNTA